MTTVMQYESAGRSEVSPPLSVVPGWDSSALSASRCVNKANFSHRFSSQQGVLRNLADVKTLLSSSELVDGGKETRFVICALICLCSEKSERMNVTLQDFSNADRTKTFVSTRKPVVYFS